MELLPPSRARRRGLLIVGISLALSFVVLRVGIALGRTADCRAEQAVTTCGAASAMGNIGGLGAALAVLLVGGAVAVWMWRRDR